MAQAIRHDVYLVSLPTHDSLTTAKDPNPAGRRELVFIRAQDCEGHHGWGECSALNTAGYNNEWARGAFGLLTAGNPISRHDHPMAFSGLEMAELDLSLKSDGISLARHIGVARTKVRAGAVVGLGTPEASLAQVASLVSDGYKRIKLKITPADVVGPVEAVRQEFAELELHVDANGSLGPANIDDLVRLAQFQVAVIEQPFAVDDQELTMRLRELTDTPVFADEAVRTLDDAENQPYFDGLVVKPGPSGGLGATLEIVEYASRNQLPLAAGGMLESGLGRHFLATIAGLDAFTVAGDVSPAGRWLAADPWTDLEMSDGDIAVPTGPGVAPPPDVELLEGFTVARGQVLLRQ